MGLNGFAVSCRMLIIFYDNEDDDNDNDDDNDDDDDINDNNDNHGNDDNILGRGQSHPPTNSPETKQITEGAKYDSKPG